MKANNTWNRIETDIFWAEIASCEHVVQIYEKESVFLDTLTGFVGCGIKANDCIIVIASDAHLKGLEERLLSYGIQVDNLKSEDIYIPLDAGEMLAKFMVNGWPDQTLFTENKASLISRAHKRKRKIRAFGEMVAILWAQGQSSATIYLQYLWQELCRQTGFSLFCAYPQSGFTGELSKFIDHVCGAHSKLINGSHTTITNVLYRAANRE